MGAAAGVVAVYMSHIRDAEREVSTHREHLLQSQKMEALGRLAGGVAHDFNNLLTVIGGYGNIVLRSLRPDDPNREEMREILGAADRAGDLTKRLLAFGRRSDVRSLVLDLNALVTGMRPLVERLVGEDVRVAMALEPDLGRMRADPAQIEQVLMNLVVNARDAMPDGGHLTISTENVELAAGQVENLAPGPYVGMVVSDSGVGMSDETRARLFEPFFTTKRAGEGTGLGLSILFGILQRSGAGVQVESTLEIGSRFEVLFPRTAEEVASAPGPSREAPIATGSETILVVEDERSVRDLSSQILRQSGYQVLEAASGDAALELSAGHSGPIDLLVTDVVMPGLLGPELAEELLSSRPALRVLFVSGYSADALASEDKDTHWNLLRKPFAPADLARAVRATLDED